MCYIVESVTKAQKMQIQKYGRTMLSSKSTVYDSRKSRLLKEKQTKEC